MTLTELNRDEKLACVALVEYFVLADQQATTDETRQIDALADALGEEAYRELMNAVDEQVSDDASLKTLLGKVERQEARNLVYGTVMDCAFADGLAQGESEMLSWLESNWNITVKYQE